MTDPTMQPVAVRRNKFCATADKAGRSDGNQPAVDGRGGAVDALGVRSRWRSSDGWARRRGGAAHCRCLAQVAGTMRRTLAAEQLKLGKLPPDPLQVELVMSSASGDQLTRGVSRAVRKT